MGNIRRTIPFDTLRFGTCALCTRAWLTILGILLCASASSSAAQESNTKDVLVLAAGRGHLSVDQMEASLRAHFPWPVNFSDTDLENPRLGEESYRKILAEELRHGFAAEKPDLVVAVMDPSLQFAVEYHDKIFPGVPIVFMSVSSPEAKQKMWRWPGVTGVASSVGIHETIDLALRLHPDTNTIAVIANVSWREKEYFAAVHDELLHYRDKVKEIDLVGPPSIELLEKVTALPPHTVVLFQLWPVETDSTAFGVNDVLAAVTQRLPTYCIFAGLCLNHGGIGGVYDDPKNDAWNLPKDVSLCLFRVAQEALHNAVRYSGTYKFGVELSGTSDEVQLEIRDSGAGFDVDEAKKDRGLGLVSMQERVHLVHGRFSVESEPGRGTRVLAVVPLAVKDGGSDTPFTETAVVIDVA